MPDFERYTRRTYDKLRNVLELYAARIFASAGTIESVSAFRTKEHLRLPPADYDCKPIKAGERWGGEWSNLWLKFSVTVPDCAEGKTFCVIPDANAVEILCFKNGVPAGIINSKNRFIGGEHSAMFVCTDARPGDSFEIALECYAGHMCPGTQPYENYGNDAPGGDYMRTFGGIKLAYIDEVFNKMVFDLSTVLEMAELPANDFLAKKAHDALFDAFPYLIQDPIRYDEGAVRESAVKVTEKLAPALEKGAGGHSRGWVGVTGHSHMDTAWLWPVSETIRKCARTYSQALTLMDMYPDYTFIQSSALHLSWMEDYYPAIFDGIKKQVAVGRYEPNGGVWVECDCNITGGESMIRQFLYGQRYTREKLGYTSDAFWLPDTFGYNGAIPQIMLGCGVKYFYTTKMSWNDLNSFPFDTFVWKGIDGSAVVTHLNVMHTMPDVRAIAGAVDGIKDKRSTDCRYLAYGFGDGGGGPTYGMLELLGRVKDIDGLPEVIPMSASEFARRLDEKRDSLPVFDGELYLEFHRGTLTSIHDIKRNNRKAEFALRGMEYFNVISGASRDADTDTLYKTMLKNQFHDILPGSSIQKVNETAIAEMTALIGEADKKAVSYASALTEGEGITLFNTLSFDRNEVFTMAGRTGLRGALTQSYRDVAGNYRTDAAVRLPAFGAVSFEKTRVSRTRSKFTYDGETLETPVYTVKFSADGYISSLYDKEAGREVAGCADKPLGTYWYGEDMPTAYDNWELEDDVFRKLKPVGGFVSREVVSDGALEIVLRSVYNFGRGSSIKTDMIFYAESRKIDFHTLVDWKEKHTVLKAGFNVAIRSAFVKNEIQFGHVDRPTTRNTSLECSRFEVCNHKWSDLSETRYGVAILNDCKYAISAEGSNLMLTLNRGGCRPDARGDEGIHETTYSLLPHIGGFNAESVVRPAYELNVQPTAVEGKLKEGYAPICEITAPGVICESVKTAEDDASAFVLRLYECERNHASCDVLIPGAKAVYLTNMLEEKQERLELFDGKAQLEFKPFEIKTLLVER